MTIFTLKRTVLALLLAVLLAPFATTAQQPGEAGDLIRDTFSRAINALEKNQDKIRATPRAAYGLIEEILAPHVDFELMSRLILARHWKDASPEQQQRFVQAFRESLLRTYSRLLSDNIDDVLKQVASKRDILAVLPVEQPDSRGRVTVRTRMSLEGRQNIPVDYRMYHRDGKWRVYDLLIENISFVMNYRTEYDAELQRGSIDSLIKRIEERNQRAWGEPAKTGGEQ